MQKTSLGLIVALFFFWAGNANANDGTTDYKVKDVRDDLMVPTSPAFSMLGLSPEDVVTPTTPKDLAASLLNGLDSNGNLQSGLAIDFSPFLLMGGNKLKLSEYRHKTVDRLLSRLQVSFAVAKGSDEADKAKRIAVGLRLALLDRADARMADDLLDRYDEIAKAVSKGLNDAEIRITKSRTAIVLLTKAIDDLTADPTAVMPIDILHKIYEQFDQLEEIDLNTLKPEELIEKFENDLKIVEELKVKALVKYEILKNESAEKYAAEINKINHSWGESNWNATNVTVGFAFTSVSETGNIGDLKGDGIAAYLSGSYGFDGSKLLQDSAHLIGMLSYRTNELVPDVENVGSYIQKDTFLAGTQLRIAGPDLGNKIGGRDLTFFLEYDFKRSKLINGLTEKTNKWSVGLDVKLADTTSLHFAIGDESGKSLEKSGTFVASNLRWSF